MELKVGDKIRSLVNYGDCVKGGEYFVAQLAVCPESGFAYVSVDGSKHRIDLLMEREWVFIESAPEVSRTPIEKMEVDLLNGVVVATREQREKFKEAMKESYVQHDTGALRESKEGKGRPDLVLAGFPRALTALAGHVDCELGCARNWEKGLPESSLISSQFRHLMGYTSGVSEDEPLYNLTANLWNAITLLESYMRVQDGVMSADVLDVEKTNDN